jgi:hypothetical protein
MDKFINTRLGGDLAPEADRVAASGPTQPPTIDKEDALGDGLDDGAV